ncbi:MAG: ACT domain-containing protein [Nitrospirota bacterium]|nr:ACT domain-containing protein [Nitrospirota bacterium]MDH5767563.1 ACT domain-containing protein [Nitrospirota bacterium]
MAKAKKSKELSFSMPDKVGLLSEISTAIAKVKVNILASCAYGMEGKAVFIMITDNNAKAKKSLASSGVNVKEEEVITVEMPNKSGELQKVAKKISEAGINIHYIYGTAGTGKTSICVFKTADDKKAIKVINK